MDAPLNAASNHAAHTARTPCQCQSSNQCIPPPQLHHSQGEKPTCRQPRLGRRQSPGWRCKRPPAAKGALRRRQAPHRSSAPGAHSHRVRPAFRRTRGEDKGTEAAEMPTNAEGTRSAGDKAGRGRQRRRISFEGSYCIESNPRLRELKSNTVATGNRQELARQIAAGWEGGALAAEPQGWVGRNPLTEPRPTRVTSSVQWSLPARRSPRDQTKGRPGAAARALRCVGGGSSCAAF